MIEMFSSALRVVLEEKEELMDLKEYGNLIFPILERGHYYLVCFDLKNLAITVINNMHPSESPVKVVDDDDFFLKSTPMKVKDVVVKYLKRVRHPRCYDIAARHLVRLEIGWATIGNNEDYGIYTMRHMETWMGIIEDRWEVGFPTDMAKAKTKIAQLRKKYAAKLITSEANKHRERILKEAYQYADVNKKK
ncbi:putative papain-like cysteine peptidase superfamily [Helianthus annuus]|nr:putative papain-like cysteine peptidase superfamily [Helianthus annuus]